MRFAEPELKAALLPPTHALRQVVSPHDPFGRYPWQATIAVRCNLHSTALLLLSWTPTSPTRIAEQEPRTSTQSLAHPRRAKLTGSRAGAVQLPVAVLVPVAVPVPVPVVVPAPVPVGTRVPLAGPLAVGLELRDERFDGAGNVVKLGGLVRKVAQPQTTQHLRQLVLLLQPTRFCLERSVGLYQPTDLALSGLKLCRHILQPIEQPAVLGRQSRRIALLL
mmetsp:Transcript_70488/g.156929  ORF Transcript_70488/g.156929 Transcript_70488/m.156929 type:complete len:221 (-) Transcript_70488:14-676(-)